MAFRIEAACGSSLGRIRKNNEDNFLFFGRMLRLDNNGLRNAESAEDTLSDGVCFAVFDGMGGEAFGEYASFAAASALKLQLENLHSFVYPISDFLKEACAEMNEAVCKESLRLESSRMGTTAVVQYLTPTDAYFCNVGDSRAYRLRNNEFAQVSVDDLEHMDGRMNRKAGLTQNLGIFTDEMLIVPHIIKCELHAEDIYLLCSDGLTDMLSNIEICSCLKDAGSAKTAVERLIFSANEKGGRDNTTVIVIRVL